MLKRTVLRPCGNSAWLLQGRKALALFSSKGHGRCSTGASEERGSTGLRASTGSRGCLWRARGESHGLHDGPWQVQKGRGGLFSHLFSHLFSLSEPSKCQFRLVSGRGKGRGRGRSKRSLDEPPAKRSRQEPPEPFLPRRAVADSLQEEASQKSQAPKRQWALKS